MRGDSSPSAFDDNVQIGRVVVHQIPALRFAGGAVPTHIDLNQVEPLRQRIDHRPPRLAAAADAV